VEGVVVGHGPGPCDERLTGHLASEDPLAVLVRAEAPKDVLLELLEVQEGDECVDGGLVHRCSLAAI
jgi:hypothetical protein